jgi:hypothetical protein
MLLFITAVLHPPIVVARHFLAEKDQSAVGTAVMQLGWGWPGWWVRGVAGEGVRKGGVKGIGRIGRGGGEGDRGDLFGHRGWGGFGGSLSHTHKHRHTHTHKHVTHWKQDTPRKPPSTGLGLGFS